MTSAPNLIVQLKTRLLLILPAALLGTVLMVSCGGESDDADQNGQSIIADEVDGIDEDRTVPEPDGQSGDQADDAVEPSTVTGSKPNNDDAAISNGTTKMASGESDQGGGGTSKDDKQGDVSLPLQTFTVTISHNYRTETRSGSSPFTMSVISGYAHGFEVTSNAKTKVSADAVGGTGGASRCSLASGQLLIGTSDEAHIGSVCTLRLSADGTDEFEPTSFDIGVEVEAACHATPVVDSSVASGKTLRPKDTLRISEAMEIRPAGAPCEASPFVGVSGGLTSIDGGTMYRVDDNVCDLGMKTVSASAWILGGGLQIFTRGNEVTAEWPLSCPSSEDPEDPDPPVDDPQDPDPPVDDPQVPDPPVDETTTSTTEPTQSTETGDSTPE